VTKGVIGESSGSTAKDRAYAYTKARVLDTTFPGGELLSEGEIAEALAMSRTPVREAFLQLETEGLLRLYPKRGALVVAVSLQEIDAVMETRLLLERFAVEKVIRAALDVSAELAAAITAQDELVRSGDARAFVEEDRRFHRIIVAAAGNPIITNFYESLRDRQARMGLVALSRDSARARQILDEHHELAGAIRRRDLEVAQRVLVKHLQGTLERLHGSNLMSSA